MLPATQRYIACRGIQNEKTSFNPLPGKAEIQHQSNFENL
jgi:hypothetical protein